MTGNSGAGGIARDPNRPALGGALGQIERAARALIRMWAVLGGVIILVLVVITSLSALSNLAFDRPYIGEYEIAKHFVGIAIFTFLPYCQLTAANVTVDIFTDSMGLRAKTWMKFFSGVMALTFSLVLIRQMSIGFGDYIRYPEETATLHIPLWTAFPPILVSLTLWAVASIITIAECRVALRGNRGGAQLSSSH
jgi:TRAP-type C4-dicarboxylate transport system permease small subunit